MPHILTTDAGSYGRALPSDVVMRPGTEPDELMGYVYSVSVDVCAIVKSSK